MKRYKKIAYVIPYHLKDTGNVSTYFIKNTENFYLYILPSTYHNRPSIFIHYKNGSIISKRERYLYRGNNRIIILLFYYLNYLYFIFIFRIKKTFIIVNNPQLCILSSLNKLFFSNDTVLWIWDYFPSKKGILKLYHWFINFYNTHLQYVVYLSPDLRKIYFDDATEKRVRAVVPFGIDIIKVKRAQKRRVVGYIGNLRKGQGLEVILDALRINKEINLEIIGDGGIKKELLKYIAKYNLNNRVTFYGFVDNDALLKIVSKWSIGAAVYDPSEKYITRYTDPSKVKLYIQYSIPVIMTKITYLCELLEQEHAGVGIDYSAQDFIRAVSKIEKNYHSYEEGILKIKDKFEYNKVYKKGFISIEKK